MRTVEELKKEAYELWRMAVEYDEEYDQPFDEWFEMVLIAEYGDLRKAV